MLKQILLILAATAVASPAFAIARHSSGEAPTVEIHLEALRELKYAPAQQLQMPAQEETQPRMVPEAPIMAEPVHPLQEPAPVVQMEPPAPEPLLARKPEPAA